MVFWTFWKFRREVIGIDHLLPNHSRSWGKLAWPCLLFTCFFQVEKLSLHWLKNVKDEHIVALVNRCKNITTLDLAFNSITNLAMNSIVENLKPTLEELNVNFTKVTFDKVLELRFMEKIRILNCRKLNRFETINLRELLDIRIKKNSTTIHVADSNSSGKPKEMFWKVKANQLPLFQANTE